MIPPRTLPPSLPRITRRGDASNDDNGTPALAAIPPLLEAQRNVTLLTVGIALGIVWTTLSALGSVLLGTGLTTTVALGILTVILALGNLRATKRLRELRKRFPTA